MPKIVDSQAQRRAIRSAARRVFARRGLVGTGLTHVAEAAGMGRSSLYHYYPDKASLVRDLMRELLDEEAGLFAAAVQGAGTPMQRIEELASGLVRTFSDWSGVGRIVLDGRSREGAHFRRFFRSIRSHLSALVREGQGCGEIDRALNPQLTAATLIGAVDGLLIQHFVDARAFPSLSDLETALLQIVRKGLKP